jgi:UDP-glucose 4-epimerase
VGTSEFISLNSVAEVIFKFVGWRPPDGIEHLMDKPTGVLHRALDGSMAKKRMGWNPKVPLAMAIEKTIRWYRSKRYINDVDRNLATLLMRR